MSEPKRRGRGRLFDQVPELYDRVRPGYPSELFANLVDITDLADHASILEVGCGTGQVTRPREPTAAVPALPPRTDR